MKDPHRYLLYICNLLKRSSLSPDASSGSVPPRRSAAEAPLHGGGARDGPRPAGISGELSLAPDASSSAFTVFLQRPVTDRVWAEPDL